MNDIQAALRVIDYAFEQGAFKGVGVVQEVLLLRNRYIAFLKTVPGALEPVSEEAEETTDLPPENPSEEV